jgi:predicted hotdog family 3-hydroxylacyl-ACP dehydratase
MRLNRAWIESNIPHQGRMCLLDEVLEWDAGRIRCRAGTHRTPDNPLRSQGSLGIAAGIEYAAQAMAVHGALAGGADTGDSGDSGDVGDVGSAQARSEAGFLAGLRDVRVQVLRIDDLEGDLYCDALLIAGNRDSALYEFALQADGRLLLSGRGTVIFGAHQRLYP